MQIQSEKYWAEVGQQIMINHINLNVKTTNQQKISNDLVITHFTLNGLEGEKVIKHIHVSYFDKYSGLDGLI